MINKDMNYPISKIGKIIFEKYSRTDYVNLYNLVQKGDIPSGRVRRNTTTAYTIKGNDIIKHLKTEYMEGIKQEVLDWVNKNG